MQRKQQLENSIQTSSSFFKDRLQTDCARHACKLHVSHRFHIFYKKGNKIDVFLGGTKQRDQEVPVRAIPRTFTASKQSKWSQRQSIDFCSIRPRPDEACRVLGLK